MMEDLYKNIGCVGLLFNDDVVQAYNVQGPPPAQICRLPTMSYTYKCLQIASLSIPPKLNSSDLERPTNSSRNLTLCFFMKTEPVCIFY